MTPHLAAVRPCAHGKGELMLIISLDWQLHSFWSIKTWDSVGIIFKCQWIYKVFQIRNIWGKRKATSPVAGSEPSCSVGIGRKSVHQTINGGKQGIHTRKIGKFMVAETQNTEHRQDRQLSWVPFTHPGFTSVWAPSPRWVHWALCWWIQGMGTLLFFSILGMYFIPVLQPFREELNQKM